ncbi:MAG TPA: minor capsid protein [Georgenia sp.]|nr:minor capsid protein [Georgenia sp.]
MNNYWRDRELEHIERMIKDDAKLAKRIRQNQIRALEEIQQQIDAFYGRYASREGITMAEARKRATKLDMEKYAKKAKRYVKERNFTRRANEEMRIYNLTMKVNRLELLKLNIELELIAAISDEERTLFQALTENARAEYERQAGILGATIQANEKSIATIVNASFLTATWSDRLWDNQDALRSELDRLLNRGIVQGINPRQLARELRKKFNTSISNSERLLRTELARVQTDVQKDCLEQAGFDSYEYIAESDACPICSALDGKVFKLSKAQAGVNSVPMHPNCRCSTAAYMSREEWDADLRARGL